MSTEVRLRRGTASQHEEFTGALAEVTVDTTDYNLRVHDGETPGGHRVLMEGDIGAAPLQVPTNALIDAKFGDGAPPPPIAGGASEFEIIGHRGLSHIYPENTAVALSNSIRRGQADSIEIDIRASSDGELYCFHDFTLDRVTNGTGLIIERHSSYINGLDAGSYFSPLYAGTRVLRFNEACSLIRGLGCNFWPQVNSNELASNEARETEVRRIVQIVKHYEIEDRAYFQCFQMPSIGPLIRKYSTESYLAALLPGDTVSNFHTTLAYLQEDSRAVILAGYMFWLENPGLVREAREAGVDVGCYTVNDTKVVDSLRKAGVVRIMTDINLMGVK